MDLVFRAQGVMIFPDQEEDDCGFKGTRGHDFSRSSYEKESKGRKQSDWPTLLAAMIQMDVSNLIGRLCLHVSAKVEAKWSVRTH
jgi:hypothetical protein